MNKIRAIIIILILLLSSCNFTENTNQIFGDQYFKTAIALIELHKIRYKEYPKSLSELKYIGEWDKIIFSSVEYQKLPNGYMLNLVKGWMGKPATLQYPPDFWDGLGLKESNLKK